MCSGRSRGRNEVAMLEERKERGRYGRESMKYGEPTGDVNGRGEEPWRAGGGDPRDTLGSMWRQRPGKEEKEWRVGGGRGLLGVTLKRRD